MLTGFLVREVEMCVRVCVCARERVCVRVGGSVCLSVSLDTRMPPFVCGTPKLETSTISSFYNVNDNDDHKDDTHTYTHTHTSTQTHTFTHEIKRGERRGDVGVRT